LGKYAGILLLVVVVVVVVVVGVVAVTRKRVTTNAAHISQAHSGNRSLCNVVPSFGRLVPYPGSWRNLV